MDIAILVLLLLILIGVSNVVHRFVPVVPVPLIQIALGAVLVVFPVGEKLVLEPELFFLLFISPLLYYDGVHAPRFELWRLRGPILVFALGLVFFTVFIVGYIVNWLIPSIPLAAAFGLAAILSPTDTLAVTSLSRRINLPNSLKNILEGEALMKDASSLVAFKYSMAAAVTGYFSLAQASVSFFVIAIGGFLVGAAIAFLITGVRQMLRQGGLEDETLQMLLQVLTPFIIYLIAEHLGVSGILAAVAGGLVHAIEKERIAISMPGLKRASDPTWSVLMFVLKGLVFILLGLQIPSVSQKFIYYPSFQSFFTIASAIIIYGVLLLLRFVWSLSYSLVRKWLAKGNQNLPSFRTLALSTISGARGAVTSRWSIFYSTFFGKRHSISTTRPHYFPSIVSDAYFVTHGKFRTSLYRKT